MVAEIGYSTKLNTSFEQAIQQTTQALENEDFDVLMQVDVGASIRKSANAHFPRYVIIGARSPVSARHAFYAFLNRLDVGLLSRCYVTVEEVGPAVVVTAAAPISALTAVVNDPMMTELAAKAKEKLEQVISGLK
jgi:uncharacterized protein (DUF302 family)